MTVPNIPGWYGYRDKSDLEAYQMIRVLRWVERLPFYSFIHNTRSFGIVRFFLLHTKSALAAAIDSNSSKRRFTSRKKDEPKEFEFGLEQLVKLSKKYDFLPLLVLEPVNRSLSLEESSKKHRYYSVLRKIAEKYDLPLVNTLDEINNRKEEWLFYDFIHPNQAGHRLIAEQIYKTLFSSQLSKKTRSFLEARNVSPQRGLGKREVLLQRPTEDLPQASFFVRAPHASLEKPT